MSLAEVIAAWDAVGERGLREAIHPAGSDPDAYSVSGVKAAERVLEAFGELPPGRLIDFGAGDGRVTLPLADRTSRSVIAVDSSRSMLAQIERRAPAGRGPGTLLADGTSPLPVAAGIYAIAVLVHHRHEDAAEIIRNLGASLLPGGKLLLDLPLFEEPRDPRDWIDVAVWTLPELESVASEAGLEILSATVVPGAFDWETAAKSYDWALLVRR